MKYIDWLSLGIALSSFTVIHSQTITEFRAKVGDVLERLKYPGKLEKISGFGDENILNTAIDFSKSSKPNFVQMALVSKDKKFSDVTFDMEYKESTSKATLGINLRRLKPGTVELGSNYDLKVFVSEANKEVTTWELGTLKMPESLEYKLPDIEDHFYKMPEIYTPEEEVSEGKKSPVYPIVGLIFAVVLPWLTFIKLWKKSGNNFEIPKFLFDNSKSKAFPLFSASLLALFGLIVSAWVYLSIFQTLGFLAVLSSTAFAFGHFSFKNVVQQQSGKDESFGAKSSTQMGITGLLPLLKSVTRQVHVEQLAGESVAIDAYSWLHKGIYTCIADIYHQRPTTAYVEYCISRIRMLQRYKVNPILVFDGGPLPMKAYREEQRAQKRTESKKKADEFMQLNAQSAHLSTSALSHMSKSADVTPEMAFMLIEALRKEKIDYIVAPYEADAQLAYLDRIGKVAAVISEDSDLLLFGIKRVLFKMDKFGSAEEVCLDRLGSCTEMDLREFTLQKFRQMCILSGCDYLAPLGGIGLKTLHKYFLKYKTLDRVLYALRREANKLISKEYETEFLKAELTFQHQRVYCPVERRIVCLTPLPEDIKSNMEIETDEKFEDLNFLGPVLEVELARGIAEGRINPITFKPFIIEELPSKENAPVKQNVSRKESPTKLNTLLKNNSVSDTNRLTLKRIANYSTTTSQSETIQDGLRYRFVNTPKYANVRKPTSNNKSGGERGKQFSILNFCVPKSSFNPESDK